MSAAGSQTEFTDVCPDCARDGRIVATQGHASYCSRYRQGARPAGAIVRLPTDSSERKRIAMFSGLIRYFPDALAYVARISHAGNEKHNPGQELHWNRAKSGDELDCVVRHLVEAGTVDPDDGFFHDGKLAWRALANLQKLLEKHNGLPISPGSTEK